MASDAVATVQRDDTPVMFLRAADDPAEIAAAWERLERRVGLRGRRFFGVFENGEYRVCAQVEEHDDPGALGLETGVLVGGRYRRRRLRGEPPRVYAEITDTFAALEADGQRDTSRPSIEHYRRRDEIDLLVPVL